MLKIANMDLLIIQIILIIIAFGIVGWLISLIRVSKLEKRFKKFSVTTIKDTEISLFDKLKNKYYKMRAGISKGLYKLKIFNDYSKKYEKYCDNTKIIREDPMDYISTKVLTSILMIIIMLIS